MTLPTRGFTACALVSLLAHAAILAWLDVSTADLDVGLEFSLPSEVEFGVTETVAFEDTGTDGNPTDPSPTTTPSSPHTETTGPETPDDPAAERPPSQSDPTPPSQNERSYVEARGTLPPGAQLAMRVDMVHVRAAPVRTEVTRLLRAIPDWQLVLDGSGIDPVEDLDRVLIASPNLRRSRVVIAGRHGRDEAWARAVVARMAAARGLEPNWRSQHGVPVAQWANRDETPRVIALPTRETFVICRRRDLRSALALARRRASEGLLSMPEGALATLTVEGAARYARGEGVPERLLAAVYSEEDGSFQLSATGYYDSSDAARRAAQTFEPIRDRAARHMLVRAVGLASAVEQLELESTDAELRLGTVLSARQARLVLGLIEGQFREFARTRGLASPRTEETPPRGLEPGTQERLAP